MSSWTFVSECYTITGSHSRLDLVSVTSATEKVRAPQRTTTAIYLTIEISTYHILRREEYQPTRGFHPVCLLASNLSLEVSCFEDSDGRQGRKKWEEG